VTKVNEIGQDLRCSEMEDKAGKDGVAQHSKLIGFPSPDTLRGRVNTMFWVIEIG
jgi:hypothetical protein